MTRKHIFPPYEMECRKPYIDHKHERETIVRCGMGMGTTPLCTNNIQVAVGTNSIPVPIPINQNQCPVIARVTLDAGELEDPIVKIDFSNLISYRTFTAVAGYYLRLVFKLSKICDGGHPIPLGTWTFERSFHSLYEPNGVAPAQVNGPYNAHETVPFFFTWCECDGCPGCCTYQVELVEQECYDIDYATVSNIFITGIAQGFKKY